MAFFAAHLQCCQSLGNTSLKLALDTVVSCLFIVLNICI